MRPETTITLNKSSFRADEPITGFVDIDVNQTAPGESDPKLWVVRLRLVGYAQMDTHWQEQNRTTNWQEKPRHETIPIEECEAIVRSTDVPIFVKPGVSNRVRSLPFRIQLSPAQLIASFNAQRGLFLVDYLLTATTRRKCPRTGWNLLKLETRTFVTITPPEVPIERPRQVVPYSPPLDDMDLFRCPFMQTIRFNYSTHLTPTTLSPSHRMSLYFPLPLYEPDEISLSLTSTLTLRHNQEVSRHMDTTLLPYATYYRPDTGGEEVLIEFDVPTKIPQTMNFKFPKGSMTMAHSLRVTMQATLFPGDNNKESRKIWSVDLPVVIRGRHYISPPLTPPLSIITPSDESLSPEVGRTPMSLRASDAPEASWIRDRFGTTDRSSDEETVSASAITATNSIITNTSNSETEESVSMDSSSPRRSVASPQAIRQLRVVNVDDIPPRKPTPTGPLPQPPESSSPSPVQIRHRLSPEKQRPTTSERPKKTPLNKRDESEKPSRGRDRSHSEPQMRSRSVPVPQDKKSPIYDPFTAPALPKAYVTSPTSETHNISPISPRTIMPPAPTAEIPSKSRASYLHNLSEKTLARRRAKTLETSMQISIPTVSQDSLPSPPVSPPATRVKFTDPEVISSSPPSVNQFNKAPTSQTSIPFPRSSREADLPAQAISPPPRKNSAPQLSYSIQPPPPKENEESDSSDSYAHISPTAVVDSRRTSIQSRIPVSPRTSARQVANTSPLRLTTSLPPPPRSTTSLPQPTSPVTPSPTSRLTSSSASPEHISRSSVNVPIVSPTKVSAPAESRLPTARPPLQSQSKPRILSMVTETTTTTKSTASRAPTASTALTSRSGIGTTPTVATKVQIRCRPNAPSLFPPSPPATYASQQSRLAQKSKGSSSDASAPPSLTGRQNKPRRQSENWI